MLIGCSLGTKHSKHVQNVRVAYLRSGVKESSGRGRCRPMVITLLSFQRTLSTVHHNRCLHPLLLISVASGSSLQTPPSSLGHMSHQNCVIVSISGLPGDGCHSLPSLSSHMSALELIWKMLRCCDPMFVFETQCECCGAFSISLLLARNLEIVEPNSSCSNNCQIVISRLPQSAVAV